MRNITDTEEVNPMKAPEIKRYMNWLGRIEYRNINCSFTMMRYPTRPSTEFSAFSTGWSQTRRTPAGNCGSVRSGVPSKTSAALRSCWKTARWRTLRSLKPDGIPNSQRRWSGSTLPPARIRRSDIGQYSWVIGTCWKWMVAENIPSPMTFPNSPLGWRRRYGTPFGWRRPALIRNWWNGSCPSGTEPEPSCAGICGGYSPSGKRSFSRTSPNRRWRNFSPQRQGILWKKPSGSHP